MYFHIDIKYMPRDPAMYNTYNYICMYCQEEAVMILKSKPVHNNAMFKHSVVMVDKL